MYTQNLFTANNIPTLLANTTPAEQKSVKHNLSPSDRIFVTLLQMGREIASMQLQGYHSVKEIICHIAQTTSQIGVLTVKLRNPLQGWTEKHTIVQSSRASLFNL